MNKYEQYGRVYEERGILKPIYKDEKITICNVCDFCYYMFLNETGLAINIKADSIKKIINDPGSVFAYFNSLPNHIKPAISFVINMKNIDDFFGRLQLAAKNEPERVVVDPELEKQIMQEFGMAGRRK